MSNINYSQDEHFTIKGHWWIPGSDKRTAGNLIYDEESMTLELYGGLNDAISTDPLNSIPVEDKFSIIHGESLDRKPITLLKSFYIHWKTDLAFRPEQTTEIYSSKLCCHGMISDVHLTSLDDLFQKCRLEIPYLESWLGDKPFKTDIEGYPHGIRLDYIRPEDKKYELIKAKSFISIIHSSNIPTPTTNNVNILHRSYIDLEPFESKSIKWFREQCSQVVNLFSLFFGDKIQSKKLILVKGDDRYLLYFPRYKVDITEYAPYEFMIRDEKVKSDLAKIFNKWLSSTHNIIKARSILFSSELRPSAYIESRFLPLMHAVEVMTKDIPSELIQSIKMKRGLENGFSLREKIRCVLDQLQNETCDLFCVDKEKFIKGIVNTRNYYTHYSSRGNVLQGNELHWAIQKVSLMLRVLLLVIIGIPEDDLQLMISSQYKLADERNYWKNISEEGSRIEKN